MRICAWERNETITQLSYGKVSLHQLVTFSQHFTLVEFISFTEPKGTGTGQINAEQRQQFLRQQQLFECVVTPFIAINATGYAS